MRFLFLVLIPLNCFSRVSDEVLCREMAEKHQEEKRLEYISCEKRIKKSNELKYKIASKLTKEERAAIAFSLIKDSCVSESNAFWDYSNIQNCLYLLRNK